MRSWIGRSVLPARLTGRRLCATVAGGPASAAATDNGRHKKEVHDVQGESMLTGVVMVAVVAWLASWATGADPIKIAYIDPLSGPFAATGENGLQQFKLAADDLNRAGGVLGRQFEVVGYDNKVSPRKLSSSSRR